MPLTEEQDKIRKNHPGYRKVITGEEEIHGVKFRWVHTHKRVEIWGEVIDDRHKKSNKIYFKRDDGYQIEIMILDRKTKEPLMIRDNPISFHFVKHIEDFAKKKRKAKNKEEFGNVTMRNMVLYPLGNEIPSNQKNRKLWVQIKIPSDYIYDEDIQQYRLEYMKYPSKKFAKGHVKYVAREEKREKQKKRSLRE